LTLALFAAASSVVFKDIFFAFFVATIFKDIKIIYKQFFFAERATQKNGATRS
jgi:hypothetical protein